MSGSESICPFCLNISLCERILAKERMFGLGDEFAYLKCVACGSLWLEKSPISQDRYYGENYYSFANVKTINAVRFAIRRTWGYALFGKMKYLRSWVMRIKRPSPLLYTLVGQGVTFNSRILDVGCGQGALLKDLSNLGFRDQVGYDPNLPAASITDDAGGFTVFRDFDNIIGTFDLVMFNHSLEHTSDVRASLRRVIALLRNKNSLLIIRIPLSDSYCQRYYRDCWVQLDAPRHVYIPSYLGLIKLLRSLEFELEQVCYDSTGFQFWGSEQYLRDMPLNDAKSIIHGHSADSIFTKNQLLDFEKRAIELNLKCDGDEAIFCFRRANIVSEGCFNEC